MHVINGKKKQMKMEIMVHVYNMTKRDTASLLSSLSPVSSDDFLHGQQRAVFPVSVILHFFFVDATYQAKGAKQSKRCFSLQAK